MEKKKTVVVYESFYEASQLLSTDEARVQLFNGMMNYGLNGVEPEFSTLELKLSWTFYKPNMDANIKRYNKAVMDGGKSSGNKTNKKPPVEIKKELPKEASKSTSTKNDVIPSDEYEDSIQELLDRKLPKVDVDVEADYDTEKTAEELKEFLSTYECSGVAKVCGDNIINEGGVKTINELINNI